MERMASYGGPQKEEREELERRSQRDALGERLFNGLGATGAEVGGQEDEEASSSGWTRP
jgi:hypothetical protein